MRNLGRVVTCLVGGMLLFIAIGGIAMASDAIAQVLPPLCWIVPVVGLLAMVVRWFLLGEE